MGVNEIKDIIKRLFQLTTQNEMISNLIIHKSNHNYTNKFFQIDLKFFNKVRSSKMKPNNDQFLTDWCTLYLSWSHT